jgi:hypothetical protein
MQVKAWSGKFTSCAAIYKLPACCAQFVAATIGAWRMCVCLPVRQSIHPIMPYLAELFASAASIADNEDDLRRTVLHFLLSDVLGGSQFSELAKALAKQVRLAVLQEFATAAFFMNACFILEMRHAFGRGRGATESRSHLRRLSPTIRLCLS